MANKLKYSQFAVLGMGNFGISIVETLAEYDVNILACDSDAGKLQEVAGLATELVQADVQDEKAIGNLGLGNFEVVILAMGDDFEASQIAAMIAKEQGADYVMVKARNRRQKKILERIGVDQVIIPEYEMGVRVAKRLVQRNVLEVLEESEDYTIMEMYPLDEWVGKTISEADVRRKHNIMILGVKRNHKFTIPFSPDLVFEKDDVLLTLSEHEKK